MAVINAGDIDKQFNLMLSVSNPVQGLWTAYCCLECGCLVGENQGRSACREQHMLTGCNPKKYPRLEVREK